MPVSTTTYEQIAAEDPGGHWELVCGHLRAKPDMTVERNDLLRRLGRLLNLQLDDREFVVDVHATKLRHSARSYYVPDVCVIPHALIERAHVERPGTLEVYDEPMPLVVEIWSPSTGEYDVSTKLTDYRQRGDLEVWLVHPYEKTLTVWRRQADGSYSETRLTEGSVQPLALPSVTVDLRVLFG